MARKQLQTQSSLDLDVLAFDADDTLWHNEPLFTETEAKFRDLLQPYNSREWIDKRLYETEVKNLKTFGYGVKGFTLSMIETAIELSQGQLPGSDIQRIIAFSKEMLATPVRLLEGVRETIASLATTQTLMVITKGDLFEQESKLARSGLSDFFKYVEIVSEKNDAAYASILKKHAIPPERFLMVGNSLKSDILPVRNLNGHALYIHYETTWQHEHVAAEETDGRDYFQLDHIALLPAFIRSITVQNEA